MGELLELHARPGMAPARRNRCGLSDDQYDREIEAMKRLKAAIVAMDLAIDFTNTCSGFRVVNGIAWEEFRHDELPDFEKWLNRVNEVRRGE